jgi:hypothetical protein
VLDTLEAAVARAKQRKCEALVILGDLFDTDNPPQQIVAEVQRILNEPGLPVYVLMGNHDLVSTAPGDHALGPLSPVVTIIDKPLFLSIGGEELCCVPFQPGPAVEWLPEVVEALPNREEAALLLHLGLASDDTPPHMLGHHDAVPAGLVAGLCQQYGFAACFSGNWHDHKVLCKDPPIVQVGTVAPTGFDNPGLDTVGTMVFWDGGDKWEVEQIPGPRFLKMRADEEMEVPDDCSVYVQIIASADQTQGAVRLVNDAADDGVISGGEVIPDAKEVRTAARKAATMARAADTLSEALSSYVENMPLPDGVDRAAVLAKARNYLEM